MAKKVIKLTEQEFYQHVRSIVESNLETNASVDNATTKASQLTLQGQYQTTLKGENGTKIIDHNKVITKYPNVIQRANDSLLSPFVGNQYLFYATDRFGGARFLTFQIQELKKLDNGVAILSGVVVYDENQMNGDIIVDFNRHIVQYAERRTRYRYQLEIDNRTQPQWDALLIQLNNM
jgi:hypothetical protein